MSGRKVFILLAMLLLTSPGWALMVGNPTRETPYEKFGMAAEYDNEKWMIRYPVGPDYKLNSNRAFLKPSLGFLRFVEGYGYFGFSNLNIPSISSAAEDFNGSSEMAFGLGLKTHYAVFYPGCRQKRRCPIRCYAIGRWLTTYSSDEVQFGGGFLHFVDSYRFQQFDMGLYGSWYLGRTQPYLGVNWTYITGRKYRKSYSDVSPDPFLTISGYYNDPGQYPKPVIGLDIDLGKGYTLTFETHFWGKSETSIGVGISQLYVPEKDENTTEESFQKP